MNGSVQAADVLVLGVARSISEMPRRVVVGEIVLLQCSILLSSEPSGRASLLWTA